MKNKRLLYYFLMFFPCLIVLIALPFLPEQIPAHYGYDNQADRWGSKYEALIFPVVTVFMGSFMLAMSKIAAKQEKSGTNNENICIIAGIATLFLFNATTLYFLYTDFHQVENLEETPLHVNQLLFGGLGVLLIIVGNIMPKLRHNSIIGLRTHWSLKNETTWKKSQRIGGITFIIAGILIILACLFTSASLCLFLSLSILLLTVIIDTIYSYQISKKY